MLLVTVQGVARYDIAMRLADEEIFAFRECSCDFEQHAGNFVEDRDMPVLRSPRMSLRCRGGDSLEIFKWRSLFRDIHQLKRCANTRELTRQVSPRAAGQRGGADRPTMAHTAPQAWIRFHPQTWLPHVTLSR